LIVDYTVYVYKVCVIATLAATHGNFNSQCYQFLGSCCCGSSAGLHTVKPDELVQLKPFEETIALNDLSF